MTVSTLINRMDYVGNGTAGPFLYTFKILSASHLYVYVGGVISTDYTVTGVGGPTGGNVTFNPGSEPAVGVSVIIIRNVPTNQLSDYVNHAVFDAETLETDLDKRCMVEQQFEEILRRTLKIPENSNVLTDIEVPVLASSFLKWNTSGDQIVCVPEWIVGTPLPTHASFHENGGSDEISLAGLSGAPSDCVLLAGRAGGQTIYGGTAGSENLTLGSTIHATKGKIRAADEIFFDSTGGYFDFGAHLNFHSQRIDVSAGHKPTLYVQVTGRGDVTQINDYKVGIKAVAADKGDVAAGTRGSLIGLLATVMPLIARTTPNYDDCVALAITNEGTAKATEGIYIDHNAAIVGGKDYAIGININCNADYGLTVQGVVSTAIRIPNNKWIAGLNVLGDTDLPMIMIDTNDQVVLGSLTVNTYAAGLLEAATNLVLESDGGVGFAGHVTLGNTTDLTANSTGVGTILFKGATNRNSSGFLKIFIGITPYYIPVFSAITA